MFNPVSKESQLHGWKSGPKPEKKAKKQSAIPKVSRTPKFECSNGEKINQGQINDRLHTAYRLHKPADLLCQCCGELLADDHDHTISQARCKNLHKTQLIWDYNNWSYSCRTCHMEWESYAGGDFEDHKNVVERMLYIKKHDPEGFQKRKARISNYQILEAIS